jgi:hypothetical protein
MQLHLPLPELTGPAPLSWEQLAPDQQVAAVAVLSRLMARAARPPTSPGEQEEPADE